MPAGQSRWGSAEDRIAAAAGLMKSVATLAQLPTRSDE